MWIQIYVYISNSTSFSRYKYFGKSLQDEITYRANNIVTQSDNNQHLENEYSYQIFNDEVHMYTHIQNDLIDTV